MSKKPKDPTTDFHSKGFNPVILAAAKARLGQIKSEADLNQKEKSLVEKIGFEEPADELDKESLQEMLPRIFRFDNFFKNMDQASSTNANLNSNIVNALVAMVCLYAEHKNGLLSKVVPDPKFNELLAALPKSYAEEKEPSASAVAKVEAAASSLSKSQCGGRDDV